MPGMRVISSVALSSLLVSAIAVAAVAMAPPVTPVGVPPAVVAWRRVGVADARRGSAAAGVTGMHCSQLEVPVATGARVRMATAAGALAPMVRAVAALMARLRMSVVFVLGGLRAVAV